MPFSFCCCKARGLGGVVHLLIEAARGLVRNGHSLAEGFPEIGREASYLARLQPPPELLWAEPLLLSFIHVPESEFARSEFPLPYDHCPPRSEIARVLKLSSEALWFERSLRLDSLASQFTRKFHRILAQRRICVRHKDDPPGFSLPRHQESYPFDPSGSSRRREVGSPEDLREEVVPPSAAEGAELWIPSVDNLED